MRCVPFLSLMILLASLPSVGLSQEMGPGTALTFSGRGSMVSIRHVDVLNPYPFTVTAWVRTLQSSGAAGLVNKYLSGAFCGWQVYLLEGRVRAWYFGDASHYVWDGSDGLDGGFIADGRWHHVAFTVGATGGRLYVDGVLVDSIAWRGAPMRTTAQQEMTLGNYPGVAPSFFRGQLDEVSLWRESLSPSAIRLQMHRSLSGVEPGLVAYYRLDEGGGGRVIDGAPADGHQSGVFGAGVERVTSTAPLEPGFPTNGLPAVVRRVGAPELEAGSPLVLEAEDFGNASGGHWTHGGVPIPGATHSVLSIPRVQPSDADVFRFVAGTGALQRVSPPLGLRVITRPEWVQFPVSSATDAGGTVTLTATATGGQPLHYTWLKNGVALAGEDSSQLTLGPVLFGDAGNYQLVARNAFGSITSAVASLEIVALALTNSLVVHLPFDGDFDDRSGRGNHARYATNGSAARPIPRFAAGQIGRAFEFTTRQNGSAFEYASLGYPADLQFGERDAYSISLWVNYLEHDGDLPLVSNKDWDKSHNPGWAISTQRAGTARLNLTGPREGSDFFSVANTPVIRNGRWRHLVVSVRRPPTGESCWVSVYVDGRLVSRTATVVQGSLDTFGRPFTYASPVRSRQAQWAVNIGQDGTGVYFDKGGTYALAARVDDLGIWRRALTELEAMAIYQAGIRGMDLSKAVVPSSLAIRATKDGEMTLVWPGAPRSQLEKTADLGSGEWIGVDLGPGANDWTVPGGDRKTLFRLTETP